MSQPPALVLSDTGVEDPGLNGLAIKMIELLRGCVWSCTVVQPLIHERLYNRILGIGCTPIHPGIRSMRWCTRSTKIDPMKRGRSELDDYLTLTGLRLGESAMRDSKIKKSYCAAGGECGIPEQSERTYSPLLNWTICQVIDWLNGQIGKDKNVMPDVFAVTKELVGIYGMRMGQPSFAEFGEPEITASRFGCIGCPAIGAHRHAPKSVVRRYGAESPLLELYDVWYEARLPQNRLYRPTMRQRGPIKMSARKTLFSRVMDIQWRAAVVLVTDEDEKFIRQCWANKVYPKGWSEEDESVVPPSDTPLFDAIEDEYGNENG